MDVVGDQGSPLQCCLSVELPEGPAMASGVPEGRGATCNVGSSSFGVTDIVVMGEQWALFRACSGGEGAHHVSTLGKGA